jgi:hypothetical protein
VNQAPAGVTLHCLGGAEGPAGMGGDLLRLLRLPPEALEKLWQVLAPSLADRLAPETGQLLDMFCAAYKIDDDDLARAMKACRFLIREAAKIDLPGAQLGEDLGRLCPDAPLIHEILLAGYEPMKARMREEILRAALVDHGKLLVGAQWRVDTIVASERGKKLGMPVAMLTLHYKDGGEARRITLQVMPDMMAELKGICEQMLG